MAVSADAAAPALLALLLTATDADPAACALGASCFFIAINRNLRSFGAPLFAGFRQLLDLHLAEFLQLLAFVCWHDSGILVFRGTRIDGPD